MSREEDKARLNQEIARLKQMHADRYGEFKLIELAAVRLGILASYACRLLETPFVFLSRPERERKLPERFDSGEGRKTRA